VLPAQLKDTQNMIETQNIRSLRQWLCWRTEERDGKPTKVPYSPLTGEKASTTNPETWTNYSEAVSAHRKYGHHGIGFVFTPEDDLCGVDLDGCLNPETGEIEGWAQEIIEELDSYTEISPSGSGVHVLVRGELPPGRNRKGKFEAYDKGRFFTVTGRHLKGTPRSIQSRQEHLECVVQRMLGEPSQNGHKEPISEYVSALSDEEIIEKASIADNGQKFRRLWAGNTSGYSSASEADAALCSLLAFWTGPDPQRIDALFRQSGLCREKWTRREDYRHKTIERALRGRTEFYQAPKVVRLADGSERTVEEPEPEKNRDIAFWRRA
jgi:putative DNA primase/helicase